MTNVSLHPKIKSKIDYLIKTLKTLNSTTKKATSGVSTANFTYIAEIVPEEEYEFPGPLMISGKDIIDAIEKKSKRKN